MTIGQALDELGKLARRKEAGEITLEEATRLGLPFTQIILDERAEARAEGGQDADEDEAPDAGPGPFAAWAGVDWLAEAERVVRDNPRLVHSIAVGLMAGVRNYAEGEG